MLSSRKMEALPAPGLPSSATCLGPEQQPSKQTKQEAHPAEELLKSPIFVTVRLQSFLEVEDNVAC